MWREGTCPESSPTWFCHETAAGQTVGFALQFCQAPPVNQPADQVLHDGISQTRQPARSWGAHRPTTPNKHPGPSLPQTGSPVPPTSLGAKRVCVQSLVAGRLLGCHPELIPFNGVLTSSTNDGNGVLRTVPRFATGTARLAPKRRLPTVCSPRLNRESLACLTKSSPGCPKPYCHLGSCVFGGITPAWFHVLVLPE